MAGRTAGGRGAPEDRLVSDPLHRGLFRERALMHYESQDEEAVPAEDPGDGGVAPRQLRGDGRVLSAAQVAAAVPALAGARGLPALGVLATGTAPALPTARAGQSLLLTASADLGEQPLFRLAW